MRLAAFVMVVLIVVCCWVIFHIATKKGKEPGEQGDSTQKEIREMDEIDKNLSNRLLDIAAQKKSLDREEENQFKASLKSFREQFLSDELSQQKINSYSSRIAGVGKALVEKLSVANIRTAADFDQIITRYESAHGRFTHEVTYIKKIGRGEICVNGIGRKKAEALDIWRRQITSAIMGRLPQNIPSDQKNAIREHYITKRMFLNEQEADAKRRADADRNACKERYLMERGDLERQ